MSYRHFMSPSHILRIEGAKRSSLDVARGRVAFVSLMIFLAYLVVAVRVMDVSLIQGEFADYHITDQMLEDVQLKQAEDDGNGVVLNVPRADIVDRNGVLLATSLETASLYADPYLIQNPADVAAALVEAMPDLVYGDVLQRLQRSGRFVWIKRNITPDEQYKILRIGSPGLAFKTEYRRFYPQGDMAAHVVGYTNVDGKGLVGLERSFDNMLGSKSDAPLKTTIDVRLQHVLTRELNKAISDFRGVGGAGVIMDVNTGEVLAASSMPDFDPHDPTSVSDKGAAFNRLSLGVYELGSTFKIFSTAAALEFAGAALDDRFDARKPIQVDRFKISDYHAEDRILSLPEVFMVSSNIGSALMGKMVGTETMERFFADLGLLSALDTELKEVGHPLVPNPWRDINTLTASYGHGIAVSPLQMVSAASSIVNGGVRVQPTFIYNENKRHDDAMNIRVVSPQTAHRMRQLLRLVVTDGTGANADVPGYRVGGKTGTAEKIVGGQYNHKKLISSFVGFFPMNEPRYAIFVMVDEPKGTRESFGYATGGWVAAPAVNRIVTSMAAVMAITPQPHMQEDSLVASLQSYINKDGLHGAVSAILNHGVVHSYEDMEQEAEGAR
ncbi:MAG: penicillin-binding protein 2 [Alphaproteobacteria bacterium]|jgi:cell division protein FtsI (penicillin-binding protein 3)|nr:penicillin-binding protein 2 [Alphaproteobacteria bacterium]MDP7223190.1 penicillin-binding protein 2 [Alphaproteobacteria bacterium]